MKQSIKFSVTLSVLFVLCNLITPKLFAQTPTNGIFFQAVARDNFSNPAKDRKIHVQSSIIQTTATGTKVLTEEYQTTTDATGVFSISIGQGTRLGGTMNNLTSIDWSKGPYFLNLKVAISPVAPTASWDYKSEWIDLGTTSFGTVPYALYAGTAAGVDQKVNLSDTVKMLTPYAKVSAVKILETGLATKLTATDTSTMLANYAKTIQTIDTAYLKSQLVTKVDKISGKDLSTNDYTTTEKTKLAAILGTNTGDQTTITGNAGTVTNGVYTVGDQTIAGTKTFNKDIVVNSVVIGKGGNTLADNIAIGNGARSGNINTGGNANIAIGTDAQKNNTGFYNVSVGNVNLVNGSGDENTALGYTVMANNTSGMRNTGVGLFSFYQNTTGNYNTAIGHGSLGLNTTGSYNTALGTSADVATNNLTNATAIGYGASVNASNSIQLGNTSVTNVKTSGTITADAVTYPKAHGTNGQVLSTTGSGTLAWITPSTTATAYSGTLPIANGGTGSATKNFVDLTTNQTITGAKTFSSDITVNGVKIGRGTGNNGENVAVGADALASGTGTRNTAIGYGAMRQYSGTSFDNNTSVGYYNLPALTTGSGNTSIGAESMMALTTGTQNTSIGNQSLINTTGNNNVGVGKRAGQTITTGSKNTIIGTDADVATAAITNASAIGYGASVSASNTIQLGNADITNVKTSGTLTAGSVTYPKVDGSNGQVLTTNGSGTASWQSKSAVSHSKKTDATTASEITVGDLKFRFNTSTGSVEVLSLSGFKNVQVFATKKTYTSNTSGGGGTSLNYFVNENYFGTWGPIVRLDSYTTLLTINYYETIDFHIHNIGSGSNPVMPNESYKVFVANDGYNMILLRVDFAK